MKKEKIKVGIVGLGLIGASILKNLSKKEDYEIYCSSSSSYKNALEYCKNASHDLNIVKNCDIIFVCTSISKTLETLEKLDKILSKNTIVADVCSFKNFLLNKKYNFNFILSHPMAGSDKSGFNSSNGDLFLNCKWLIEKENNILNEIIKDLGAKAYSIDMNIHDALCAEISHFPAVLSTLLFNMASCEAKKIASSGFRDMTRLAGCENDLTFEMFKNNEENILRLFDLLTNEVERLKNLSDDEKINLFKEVANKRSKMYDNCGKNIL